jgi:predicted SAM-dependent methyltransferase
MKLHLGCGRNYLEGYVNIDLPSDDQTVMQAKADIYKDIRELEYPENSIDEVRNHHLFEHFSRPEALKMLLRWRKWLKVGGSIFLETPDFETGAALFVKADIATKFKIARHMFGSHEETVWSFHKDWWGEEKFNFVLSRLGFENIICEKATVQVGKEFVPDRFAQKISEYFPSATDFFNNITVKAQKSSKNINEKEAAREILSMSLVGKDKGMLEAWMDQLD